MRRRDSRPPGPDVEGELALDEVTVDQEPPAPTITAAGGGLGHKTSRGIAVTLGGQWGRTLLQTASTIVLARLLLPQDFGLLAMVTAIIGVADLLRDFGLSGAIVQVKTIGDSLWRSLLWLSVVLGVVLTGLVAASAPLIAALYGDDRLVLLTLALAPGLLVNGLCMPLQTKLQRELRFGTLAKIDVVSMGVGVVASIVAAFLGWGVWSLVLLNGAGVIYRLIALLIAVRPKFGRPRIRREVLPLVTTGGSIFGVQILNYAARNLDNVIIGRFLGAGVLGQYSRAYALLTLPISQLNGPLARVALPVLSQLQDDPERYRKYVRSAMLVLGYVSLHVFAIAGGLAAPLIALLLGPNWDQAAVIFTILALAGIAQTVGNVQGWLYISLGRAHRQLVYYAVTRPIVIGSFFLGIWWGGVQGLALVYGIVSILLLVPGFMFAIRGTFVTGADVFGPLVRPLVLAPLSFIGCWVVANYVPLPDILLLVIGGLVGLVPLGISLALRPYRRDVGRLVDFVRTMRKPKAAIK
ncbi:lipopolysaccharide biosynthesis protein [Amnibacterium flavum]|uniref:Polysaccharide biosynthesis protein n=1 Tax=Amnibacterium flavum TaxID=2173173 RepID=A0A2V1HYL1_9MICO|nr:lipopolysaccharide biosynthesis protein [Amnibacterium flavum]PVZ95907.1 polysaccharide biosynthesis protein [Amnibacterium flavum]